MFLVVRTRTIIVTKNPIFSVNMGGQFTTVLTVRFILDDTPRVAVELLAFNLA